MLVLTSALLGVTAVQAVHAMLSARQSITPLTTAQVDSFDPYSHYASAAYSPPAQILAWDCKVDCAANANFKPVAAGGDGFSVQYWYVGYDPDLHTVIVAHQGTNPLDILALITDGTFFLKNLDPSLFPGLSSDIQVHDGFADAQSSTAKDVLAAVQQSMSKYGSMSVTVIGHSLGGAITLLDSAYLPLWLPTGTTFKTVTYGLPRVGNQAFADYVDANLHLTHVNNKEDPIPTFPSTILGYVHPSGEVHIQDSDAWMTCPGQDNPSTECIVGDVPTILEGDVKDHSGPYNGIMI